jgi:hypothetical protein
VYQKQVLDKLAQGVSLSVLAASGDELISREMLWSCRPGKIAAQSGGRMEKGGAGKHGAINLISPGSFEQAEN